MSRATRTTALCAALLGLFLAGCGREIAVPEDSPDYRGALLFQERCSGCHTLTAAASDGSKPVNQVGSNDRTNGPNLDQRVETADDVLFAIRNGGFSGAIMPANIVVGQDAQDVAEFVAKYAGTERPEGLGGSESATSTPAPAPTDGESVDEGTEGQADDTADEGSGQQGGDEQQNPPE